MQTINLTDTGPELDLEQAVARLEALSDGDRASLHAWWRAANYLTVGQIYLGDNPLLRRELSSSDIKPRLLGHWGTSPGLSFMYAHVSRLIRLTGQQSVFLTGPGHGGPALVAASWLEGSYSEIYPTISQDEEGLKRLFRQFSSPGGIPSHVSVTTPGSIHEGGELGYVLVHAFGAVMDNPDLLAVAVVGDGEAETGPLEGAWKGISFLNPERDGAVLPVLHLNGAKISGPTVLARKDPAEVRALLEGHGYHVLEVGGDDLPGMHDRFAAVLAQAWGEIRAIQLTARGGDWNGRRPHWPLIILRTPKGWTGPDVVDGVQMLGTFRAHQVPLSGVKDNPEHLALLKNWLSSYAPEELFDEIGRPTELVRAACPSGDLRMSATPHANGGLLTKDLVLPDYRDFAVDVTSPGVQKLESTRRLGEMLREVYRDNPDTFRLFCPDETNSNRLGAVFEVSDRAWMEEVRPGDDHLSRSGRVMEVLSEHNCHGWLEGYTLTGRHGMFATYEAFAMVSASQTVQHAKWLEEAEHLQWRAKVPSLNILLTSTAWRNDHNGFSHQGPGLITTVLTQRGSVARIYLPPDANTLLSVADHCLRSRSYVNLIVIDKQPQLQYLSIDEAQKHCAAGAGVWEWAGNDTGDRDPDVILACAGDVVTMETVAAAQILTERLPQLRVRVVNVVDLMSLIRRRDHPHGMDETLFRELFTDDTDVVFAFHGFPGAVHQLVHGRPSADRFHVRGFIEEGTTTTPFDMTVRNKASRYHLVIDALNNARRAPQGASELKAWCEAKLVEHDAYVRANLEDLPEIRDWSLAARD
jgi:xylulose-5-phosphate/fructose-6-phosphate phosphoketolase